MYITVSPLFLSVWPGVFGKTAGHCPVASLSMFSLLAGPPWRFPFAVAKLQPKFPLRKSFYVFQHIFLPATLQFVVT